MKAFKSTLRFYEEHENLPVVHQRTSKSWRALAYQEVILRIGPLAKLIEAM